MAKLTGPLFSLSASGSIADTLTYFTWKGLNIVRQRVVPANPNTALQQTQRGYLSDAVDAIHAALALAANPLAELDTTAYSGLASALGITMTWFNTICKLWMDAARLGRVPVIYRDGTVVDADTGSIDITVRISEETAAQLAAAHFFFGTSRTSLIHSVAAAVTPGVLVELVAQDLSAFLTAGVKYFFQVQPDTGDPCQDCDSGIYSFWAE